MALKLGLFLLIAAITLIGLGSYFFLGWWGVWACSLGVFLLFIAAIVLFGRSKQHRSAPSY